MRAYRFLVLGIYNSPGVRGQTYENQLRDLREDSKEAETTNHSRSSG